MPGVVFWEGVTQMELFAFLDGVSSSPAVSASLWLGKVLQTAEVIQVRSSHSMTKVHFKLIYYLLLVLIELRAFLATPTCKLEID